MANSTTAIALLARSSPRRRAIIALMPRLAAVIAKLLDRSAAIRTMSHYAISSVNAPTKDLTKREPKASTEKTHYCHT
jgi:hypothetical protein